MYLVCEPFGEALEGYRKQETLNLTSGTVTMMNFKADRITDRIYRKTDICHPHKSCIFWFSFSFERFSHDQVVNFHLEVRF